MKQILIGALLFILLFATPSSHAQGAVHCGFPGQPYGGFITSPSLVMPVHSNNNQWGQQNSANVRNQQLTRGQQTYNNWNSQQVAYQSSNWQFNGGYGQSNQQHHQSNGWGQQAYNPYQMQGGQTYMSSAAGSIVGTNQVLSYTLQFNPGDVVTYSCRERSYDILQGPQQNRTCQEDGTWSGSRPWCDLNVAYGRMATFDDVNLSSSNTPLITDGISSTDDGAECILLKKGGGAYFSVNLETQLPVSNVFVVGKPGEGMENLIGPKLTLGSAQCQLDSGNKTALKFQCNRNQYQISQSNQIGNTIRFEHGSQFQLDVCEIVAYANPTLNDCGEPEIPAHGNATITTNSMDLVVTYACEYGYELRGNTQRTCRGRSWDGQQATCVEVPVSSTLSSYSTSENPLDGQYPVNEAMPAFAIVLIVLCVALAIGLLVAFLVLMKYGKLKCCTTAGGKSSKSKPNYAPVTAASSSTVTPVSTMKHAERSYKDPAIRTELACVDEQSQRSNASNSAYSELDSEPRNISPRETRSQAASGDGPRHTPTVYADIVHDRNVNNAPDFAKKESDDTSTVSSFDASTNRRDSPKTNRRSYVPPSYAKHSPPEIQMRQKAVNDELSERVSRITDF